MTRGDPFHITHGHLSHCQYKNINNGKCILTLVQLQVELPLKQNSLS